jgi:hypothetical protein
MSPPEFLTVRGVRDALKAEFKLACTRKREKAGDVISSLLVNYIAECGYDTDLWPGYARVRWAQAKPGDVVFLAGASEGSPEVYGPNTVSDPGRRVLKNILGAEFIEPRNVLLKKV